MYMYKNTGKKGTDMELVKAILMDGSTVDEQEAESKRQSSVGQMAIIFPSKELMNLWLKRIATPSKLPL